MVQLSRLEDFKLSWNIQVGPVCSENGFDLYLLCIFLAWKQNSLPNAVSPKRSLTLKTHKSCCRLRLDRLWRLNICYISYMGLKFILNHHENLAKKLRKLTAGLLAPILHLFKQGQREHRLLIWYQIRLFCTEWCTQDLKG